MTENERLKKYIEELEQGSVKTQLNNLQNESYLTIVCTELGFSVEEFKKKLQHALGYLRQKSFKGLISFSIRHLRGMMGVSRQVH